VEVSFIGACLTVETTRNMGYYAYMRNIVNSVHSYVQICLPILYILSPTVWVSFQTKLNHLQ